MRGLETNWRSRAVLLIGLGAAIGLTGCGGGEAAADAADGTNVQPGTASAIHERPSDAEHAAAMEVAYTCADDETFTISFAGQEQIHITLDGETQVLERTAGHMGMLFANDDIVFYSRGREASVEVGGEPVRTDCVAQGHPE